MKKRNGLDKRTIFLLLTGTLLMSFTLLTNHFFETLIDIEDFFKGFGLAIVISALIVQSSIDKKTSA